MLVAPRDEERVRKLYDVPTAWPLEHEFRDQPLQTEQWTFRRLPVCLTGGCQTGQKKKKKKKKKKERDDDCEIEGREGERLK